MPVRTHCCTSCRMGNGRKEEGRKKEEEEEQCCSSRKVGSILGHTPCVVHSANMLGQIVGVFEAFCSLAGSVSSNEERGLPRLAVRMDSNESHQS